jgi:hypothetical protein
MGSVQAETSSALAERRKSRPWTVRAIGLLLLVQAAGCVAISAYHFLPFDWETDVLSPQQVDALFITVIFLPSAILAFLSAVGFLFLFRTGWLLAMAVQGGVLLGCLLLYLGARPPTIYPVMIYCAAMAFYLNSFDVRVAFYGRAADHGP